MAELLFNIVSGGLVLVAMGILLWLELEQRRERRHTGR